MRPISRLVHRKNLTFGGTGGSFEQPLLWVSDAQRDAQEVDTNFLGYVRGAYKANGVVFACILARMLVFSEVRFRFQNLDTGELRRDSSLSLLERPWPNGTTGELLARMEQDASLSGNFYMTPVTDRLRRLRPDWLTIITGSESGGGPNALDARVVGYAYKPSATAPSVLLDATKVAHWSPIPDPEAHWKGMSWITPIIDEIKGDKASTKHKLKYFEHGTVGGVAITYEKGVAPEVVERFAKMWKDQHSGVDNAYKTFHLGGGADAKTLGADLKQLDFKVTQGAGETRIAAASGVGAIIAQLSEGMQGSSLNAGNYSAARRRFADGLLRPNWRSASAALEALFPAPPNHRLTYDASDVSFLQEDEKDAAEIQEKHAATINVLSMAGFNPDAVVRAVTAGDLRSLVGNHSGLFSAQLQSPAESDPAQGNARQLSLVEMIQKVYLGVGVIITAEEGRAILNRAGANLTGPGPTQEG